MILSSLRYPYSATPKHMSQLLLHMLDGIKGHRSAGLGLQVFEQGSQADKGLVAVARSVKTSVNSGITRLGMIHGKS